jgi:hypothetical protein
MENKEPEQPQQIIDRVNLDNLPKTIHNWTDRGAKLTCEGASHPPHEAWKFRPVKR